MNKLKEAQDNAEAAAINLSTVALRPGQTEGLVRNARLQLNKALALLVEYDAGSVPPPARAPTVTEFKEAIGRVLESVAAERTKLASAMESVALDYDGKWLRALQEELGK